MSVDAVRLADGLHQKAKAIRGDGDLTATGQAKALAREVAGEVTRYQGRIREEARRLDQQRQQLRKLIDSKAGAKLSEAQAAEWRAALRGLARDERIATIRAAAAGAIAGSAEIMATISSAASPVLLGFTSGDAVILDAFSGDYRAEVAAEEVQQIAELDEVLSEAQEAAQWLNTYGRDLVGGDSAFGDAMAGEKGGRPLSELTNAEKVARVQAAIDRGEDAISGLFTPTDGEGSGARPADARKFAAMSMAEKIAAVEAGAGKSTAEIVGSAGE